MVYKWLLLIVIYNINFLDEQLKIHASGHASATLKNEG